MKGKKQVKDLNFIIVNPQAEAFYTLSNGNPVFTGDWKKAKEFSNLKVLHTLERTGGVKLEAVWDY